MSEINLTDQRPKTTTATMPEWARARKPLPPDPALDALKRNMLAKLRERMDRRTDERRMAERRQG